MVLCPQHWSGLCRIDHDREMIKEGAGALGGSRGGTSKGPTVAGVELMSGSAASEIEDMGTASNESPEKADSETESRLVSRTPAPATENKLGSEIVDSVTETRAAPEDLAIGSKARNGSGEVATGSRAELEIVNRVTQKSAQPEPVRQETVAKTTERR